MRSRDSEAPFSAKRNASRTNSRLSEVSRRMPSSNNPRSPREPDVRSSGPFPGRGRMSAATLWRLAEAPRGLSVKSCGRLEDQSAARPPDPASRPGCAAESGGSGTLCGVSGRTTRQSFARHRRASLGAAQPIAITQLIGATVEFWKMVPRKGLEPSRLAPLVPETSASTNSATWARRAS